VGGACGGMRSTLDWAIIRLYKFRYLLHLEKQATVNAFFLIRGIGLFAIAPLCQRVCEFVGAVVLDRGRRDKLVSRFQLGNSKPKIRYTHIFKFEECQF